MEIWETDKSFLASLTLDDTFDLETENMSLKSQENKHTFSITEEKGSIKYLHNEAGRTIWEICKCARIRKKMDPFRTENAPTEYDCNFVINLKYNVKKI